MEELPMENERILFDMRFEDCRDQKLKLKAYCSTKLFCIIFSFKIEIQKFGFVSKIS